MKIWQVQDGNIADFSVSYNEVVALSTNFLVLIYRYVLSSLAQLYFSYNNLRFPASSNEKCK